MYNALLQSPRRVDDPNKADVIFVYDYCRFMCALPSNPSLRLASAACASPLPRVMKPCSSCHDFIAHTGLSAYEAL